MRQFPRLVAVAALALVLSGCATEGSTPQHLPTDQQSIAPTAGESSPSSEVSDADVRAAKQAYLDYTAAIGQMDPRDKTTFAPAFALAAGEQLKDDRDFYNQLADKGWSITGSPRVTRIDFIGADVTSTVQFEVCMDSSDVRFFDAEGAERQASPVRVQLLTVTLTRDAAGTWLVANHSASTDPEPC